MRIGRGFLGVVALAAVVATAGRPLSAEPIVWEVDTSHTTVGFAVRHMMVTTVRGGFGAFSGTVEVTDGKPETARIKITVDTASVDTREARRDQHLRSADFFDVEQFPTMIFESETVEAMGADGLRVSGKLTLRGVTRPVVLDVTDLTQPITDPGGNQRVGASATARIKRSEFGLTWNRAMEAGGVVVGDEVTIQVDVQLVRKK